MSFISEKSTIRVVGANPEGGGVLTYVKNLSSELLNFEIYGYREYNRFVKDIRNGDTIFFNVVKPSIPYLLIVLLLGRTRFHLVYCGHGLNYKNNIGLRRFIVRICERWISKRMNSIIVLNNKDLFEFKKWNINSFVIPTSLRPKTSLHSTPKSLNRDSVSWVAVGKVEKRKDPFNFIQIAQMILKDFPDDKFTWIGDGPLLAQMKSYSASLPGCDFIGGMKNEDVRKHLFETNIFLCTSTFEVLPISILEAVEAGTILVVRDYYYSSDIVNRFKSCLIYQTEFDVLQLRRNSKYLHSLKTYAIDHQSSLKEQYVDYMNKIARILC